MVIYLRLLLLLLLLLLLPLLLLLLLLPLLPLLPLLLHTHAQYYCSLCIKVTMSSNVKKRNTLVRSSAPPYGNLKLIMYL